MKRKKLDGGMFFLVCDKDGNAKKVAKSGILLESNGGRTDVHMVNVRTLDVLTGTVSLMKWCRDNGFGDMLIEMLAVDMLESNN